MRSEDEIRREIEYIDGLDAIILGDGKIKIRTLSEEETKEFRAKIASGETREARQYDPKDEPKEYEAFNRGLMFGRWEALSWAIDDIKELYGEW